MSLATPPPCAVDGCEVEATHAVFEAAVDPVSGEAFLRADPLLPQLCATHAGVPDGRLERRDGLQTTLVALLP